MNKSTLNTVALVAGGFALVAGIWGIVERGTAGDNEAAIEETMMWIAISIIVLAISAIASALANRQR